MIKMIKISLVLAFAVLLNSCAGGYKKINPKMSYYASKSIENNILFEYKYASLEKKYRKKAEKNGINILSVKITNNTEKDITFGKDFKLVRDNGNDVFIIETEKLFRTVKQSPASYLWYLLLTPTQFYTTSTNSNGYTEQTSSFPIGIIIGPGIAGGNMLAASTANKKFKQDLLDYNLLGKKIKPGETVYGLLGIRSKMYNSIYTKLK